MARAPCPGCGGLFEERDGPIHRYMLSSPGCWAVYGEVLAREYSDPAYGRVHRLSVDAYAVQHPGIPSPQSIQSVAVHLIRLCLLLDKGVDLQRANDVIKAAAESGQNYVWLTPPASLGEITVADVYQAQDPDEHEQRVRRWASSAWIAWSGHHATVRSWLPNRF
jgi:Family of unknown function (DUF5946)